jgi:flagellar M-ring protein FliF
MDNFLQQAKDLWRRWQTLSFARRATFLTMAALCFGFAGVVWWVAQPEYRVLYTGLTAEESGPIISKLQSKAVPYKLASSGSTILVPAEQAMQVHLDLSADGVPGSTKIGKGFDLFDQPMLGATPFSQNVNFMRAQQAELAKTIMQIDPVLFARVHVVRPEPSPFVRDQKPTTASIMVKLRPGATLSRGIISGIAALVSGSVEGLAKENVRIVDAHGHLLSESRDPETGLSGSFLEQRKEVEQYLAAEAERMLTHILGSGRAIVRVTAELNTKQMREKKEIINVEGKVPRSEKITLNKTTSNGPNKGGAAGSSSNLGRPTTSVSLGGSTSNQETQQSEYDYPRTYQEWQNKQGSIERLTIAAFVDTSGADGEIVSIANIQEIIKKAVGFKSDRDEIQVTQVRVPTPNTDGIDQEWATHQRWQTILTMVRNSSIAMVALCGCVIMFVMLRRRAQPATTAAEPPVDKLQQVARELDRNPEVLSVILSRWLERSESSDRAAAA